MPAISTELFKNSYTTAPKALNAAVIDFCREISPDAKPRYLPVMPDPMAQPSECFNNVMARVSKEGGTLVYGWLVWEWPNVFIEAEHHAVWESKGTFVDITPHVHGESEISSCPTRRARMTSWGKNAELTLKGATRGSLACRPGSRLRCFAGNYRTTFDRKHLYN